MVTANRSASKHTSTRVARHVLISGHVQGVGFRRFVAATAQRLHLGGWVRNNADGEVEIVVYGMQTAVAQLLARTRQGPPLARVDHVLVRAIEDTAFAELGQRLDAHRTFEVL